MVITQSYANVTAQNSHMIGIDRIMLHFQRVQSPVFTMLWVIEQQCKAW